MGNTPHLFGDGAWDGRRGILSGLMWKQRATALPAKVRRRRATALGLGADENLGEFAAFAYSVSRGVAVVQYNQQGARHTAIRMLLSDEYGEPVVVEPQLSTAILGQLAKGTEFRKIELGIARRPELNEVLAQLGELGPALDLVNSVEGVRMKVEISMGYERGGLGAKAKSLMERLLKYGQNGEVVTLAKAKAAIPGLDEVSYLDFLGAITSVEHDVPIISRELCRNTCLRVAKACLR